MELVILMKEYKNGRYNDVSPTVLFQNGQIFKINNQDHVVEILNDNRITIKPFVEEEEEEEEEEQDE